MEDNASNRRWPNFALWHEMWIEGKGMANDE
jgi:hypothetical protein